MDRHSLAPCLPSLIPPRPSIHASQLQTPPGLFAGISLPALQVQGEACVAEMHSSSTALPARENHPGTEHPFTPGVEQEKRQILLPNLCLLSLVSCDCLHNCGCPDIIPPTATVLQSLVLGEGCDLTPLLQQLISILNCLHCCPKIVGIEQKSFQEAQAPWESPPWLAWLPTASCWGHSSCCHQPSQPQVCKSIPFLPAPSITGWVFVCLPPSFERSFHRNRQAAALCSVVLVYYPA